jgi:hypothetical protein
VLGAGGCDSGQLPKVCGACACVCDQSTRPVQFKMLNGNRDTWAQNKVIRYNGNLWARKGPHSRGFARILCILCIASLVLSHATSTFDSLTRGNHAQMRKPRQRRSPCLQACRRQEPTLARCQEQQVMEDRLRQARNQAAQAFSPKAWSSSRLYWDQHMNRCSTIRNSSTLHKRRHAH